MFDIDEEQKAKLRGQVGIGTLIVFIAMVLVAAIAAGVLIDTAGFLQSKSSETGQQSSDQVTNRIQVLQTAAIKTEADQRTDAETLGGLTLTVTKAPGAEDITLTDITMQWIDDTGTYDLVHEDVFKYDKNGNTNLDGAFAHRAVKDEDDSLTGDGTPVLNTGDDRAVLAIDVGQNDVFDDNRIGDVYDNHTYDDTSGYDSVTEQAVLNDVGPVSSFSLTGTEPYELEVNGGTTTDYSVGTVVRSTVNYESGSGALPTGLGLTEGTTASIRITTGSAATTVDLVIPTSLSGRSAARL